LRDLTRARTDLNRDRVRQIHRLEKLLQDAGIKLSSVATDIMGQSSRSMLDALIEGTTDPAALADLAQRRLRSKIPVLTEALTGRFTPHHGHLIRMYLELIDSYAAALSDLDVRIVDALSPSLAAPAWIAAAPNPIRVCDLPVPAVKATDCNSCVRSCRVRCEWWPKRTRCSVGCWRRSRSSGRTACCCW
jgi:hypothetical protein